MINFKEYLKETRLDRKLDKYVSDEWEAYIQSTKDLTARLRAEAGLTP